MDELSSARATAPAPIFATAKFCSSSGESAETKVSMACTRRALVPSWRAAASAPSSPISSRVLKMKITGCLSFVLSSRRSARISAAQPMRSSNERPVARVPASRTYCFGIVIVWPSFTPSDSAPARDVAPTLTRTGGGVRRVSPESRGRKMPGMSPTRVDQGGLRLEEREDEAAAVPQAERPVGVDRVDAEADLIQVCHDDDRTLA